MRPILFHLGPIEVRSYSLFVILGFLFGLWYAMSAARRRMARGESAITPDQVFAASLAGLFIGIFGTRILYVIFNWSEYRGNLLSALNFRTGGLTFIGAPIFVFPYLYWYCRRHKLPFLAFADLIAPAFALGHAIGRIGCLLNGCCFGSACDLSWAMVFHREGSPAVFTPPSHPTQLYSFAMNLISFALLALWYRRPHRDGQILLGFAGLYCATRFVEDIFRRGATADTLAFGLTHGQVIGLILLPIILFALWRMRRQEPSSSPDVDSITSTKGAE